MSESLESILCTRCGLCCNGSLFADVELAGRREAERMEMAGVEVEDDEEFLLIQPCKALRGKRCSIYARRPECCRTFECLLLQQTKRDEVTVTTALKVIDDALMKIKTSGPSEVVARRFLGA